jgi:YhcH/YjgK/YiaL family protein
MLLDTLANSHLYEGIHPSFPKAFDWLRAFDQRTADGKYEIAPGLTAMVQRYETAESDSKKWEAHRLNGDIQVVYQGAELIGHARTGDLTIKTPYIEEKDMEIYESPASPSSRLYLSSGCFAVFLPQDAHQPGVLVRHSEPVLKVVMKFLLNVQGSVKELLYFRVLANVTKQHQVSGI